MPVPPPRSDYGLWPAVSPRVGGWIATNEDAVRELAELWTTAGSTFSGAMARGGRPAGFIGPVPVETGPDPLDVGEWPDQAGIEWTRQQNILGTDLETQDTQLQAIGGHAMAFADDVTYAKQAIVQTIEDNLETYGMLVTAPTGVDAGLQELFVSEIARAINAFLDEMAGLIAGRPIGVTELPARPVVNVDHDDLDGFGVEEAADWAGVASAGLGTAALAAGFVFPPLALALGGLSVATGIIAASQHTVEAIADPSPGNLFTVAGDYASVVPGLGGVVRGGSAFADAVGSTSPVWVDVATGLSSSGRVAEAGAVLQGGTNVLPQVPTVVDLTTPGGPSELEEEIGNAGGVGYTASRTAEAFDFLTGLRLR